MYLCCYFPKQFAQNCPYERQLSRKSLICSICPRDFWAGLLFKTTAVFTAAGSVHSMLSQLPTLWTRVVPVPGAVRLNQLLLLWGALHSSPRQISNMPLNLPHLLDVSCCFHMMKQQRANIFYYVEMSRLLNKHIYFSQFRRLEVQDKADLVSGESPHPSLHTAAFLIPTWWRAERGNKLSWVCS